ncbi:hypothetical protein LCGC14_1567020 [marine sediment metagenome]|uniref:Uncharacterized protein n=1 Tax=marine sediment metagenome TaxID=412755 RepID=A0A0F9L1U4_9ZZZZ
MEIANVVEYIVESEVKMLTLDVYGRVWDNPIHDKCVICGQPDNCGECNHKSLTDADVIELGGKLPNISPPTYHGIRPIKF